MEDVKTILMIGDPKKLFLGELPRLESNAVFVCLDVFEGIQKASQGSYDVIALDTQGLALKLGAILKGLRNVSQARIVLMSQIYDEPVARRYLASECQSSHLADDYVIYPAGWQRWLNSIGIQLFSSEQGGAPERECRGDVGVDIEQRLRELERLATEDDLTGLKNRRYVREFCRQILDHADSDHGRVTLLIYDIDDFKHYNDEYGHATGDRILCEAATLMRRCCRGHDVVARIGGDEFAVVFWDDPQQTAVPDQAERRLAQAAHPEEPIFIARRFQRELERAELAELGSRGQGILTISGGLARFPQDAGTVEELFEKADMALLESKRSGKNRISLVGTPPEEISLSD